nr:YSIRK-type signal peptide-containing protein [Lactobacillus gasseri]
MFGDKHNHYSIRKLSVGAASVLIGATIYLGGGKHPSCTR